MNSSSSESNNSPSKRKFAKKIENVPKMIPADCINPEHALVKIAAFNPDARSFGVSKPICPSCLSFLRRYAAYRDDSIAISTPDHDYIYRKDGSVLLVVTENTITQPENQMYNTNTTHVLQRIHEKLQTQQGIIYMPSLVQPGLYPPILIHTVYAAEQRLGCTLPTLLRQIYTQVANGGFGPGYGLIGIEDGMRDFNGNTLDEGYRKARQAQGTGEVSWIWPEYMVPICHWGCGIYSCLDCSHSDAPVFLFDGEWSDEHATPNNPFYHQAHSFEQWITQWLEDVDLWRLFYKY